MYSSLYQEFLSHMMENPKDITSSMHLVFVAKNFERIGDYATAVGEQAVYRATGSLPFGRAAKRGLDILCTTVN